jgi:dihydroorotate dehydrogenase
VPLIAHDWAGFGGALASCGVATFAAVLFGRPSRILWEALLIAGLAGFAGAIGVHRRIRYTSL